MLLLYWFFLLIMDNNGHHRCVVKLYNFYSIVITQCTYSVHTYYIQLYISFTIFITVAVIFYYAKDCTSHYARVKLPCWRVEYKTVIIVVARIMFIIYYQGLSKYFFVLLAITYNMILLIILQCYFNTRNSIWNPCLMKNNIESTTNTKPTTHKNRVKRISHFVLFPF